jgi:hypothetical protein
MAGSPATETYNAAGNNDYSRRIVELAPDTLHSQAQLADSGATASGGTDVMASGGQLNPDYSRWLMGLPIAFSNSVDTAMRLFRKLRKRSSKVSGNHSIAAEAQKVGVDHHVTSYETSGQTRMFREAMHERTLLQAGLRTSSRTQVRVRHLP